MSDKPKHAGLAAAESMLEEAFEEAMQRARDVAPDAVRAIADHNEGCFQACGMTTQHDYVRDSRRDCVTWDGYGKRCPDCPQDWLIEWPAGSGKFERG